MSALAGPALRAFALGKAAALHRGQLDAAGAPYQAHLNRVEAEALSLLSARNLDLDRFFVSAVAALHDSFEDTSYSVTAAAADNLPLPVVHAISALSHGSHEPRSEYLERVVANPLALVVKVADNRDNANPTRLALVSDPLRRERLRAKYEREFEVLHAALSSLPRKDLPLNV